MKILSRLPPKTLIKFRFVSKSWCSMISDPYFIKQHTLLSNSISPNTNQLIVRCYSKPLNTEVYSVHTDDDERFHDNNIKIEYPFRDYVRFYYRIVGSCNGVLCLLDDQFGQADSIQLWNPVIMRKLTLPAPQSSFENLGTCTVVLGFGFDARSHDYKVVRIAYVRGDCEYLLPPRVEVYSLNRGGWHTVEGEIPNYCVPEHFWSQVFIDGRAHWVAYKVMGKNSKLENAVMAFDVALEAFEEMPLPEALENELSFNLGAVDIGGKLAVVRYDGRVWSTSCSVWVMREYGDVGSWSRDYDVSLGGGMGMGMVIGVRRNGDVLVSTRYGGLVSYDPVSREYEDVVLFGTGSSYYVGPYRESLVLLAEGDLARQRVPSESESEEEMEYCESSDEDDEDEDRLGDVGKSEFWIKCSMSQYLTALLRRPYL